MLQKSLYCIMMLYKKGSNFVDGTHFEMSQINQQFLLCSNLQIRKISADLKTGILTTLSLAKRIFEFF